MPCSRSLRRESTWPQDPGWANSFFVTGCKELISPLFLSCSLAPACPSDGITTSETFPIEGCPGHRYKVKFRFSAVVEPKEYQGGTQDSNYQAPADQLGGIWDGFYRDGEPVESDANVWKLAVFDEHGDEVRHYYLNAFPADVPSVEHTYLVQHERTIVVVGGGHVAHSVHSPKCRAAENCGSTPPSEGCGGARSMAAPDNAESLPASYQDQEDLKVKATPLLSTAYMGVGLRQAWHSQVGKLTVLSVEATEDPVTTDYP